MKRILGGIVCLVLPTLALAQDGGTADGIDVLLAQETLSLIRPAPDDAIFPVAAARVIDGDGTLLMVGGVEQQPSGNRPYRQWDPTTETWFTQTATLPPGYLANAVVAAAWVDSPPGGLLTFGMEDVVGANPVPAAHLSGSVLRIQTGAPCVSPPAEFGSPIFAKKPADAFSNKDTLVLYLREIDSQQPAVFGRLYGVSVVAGQSICLLPIYPNRNDLPTDHIFGNLVFDPAPGGGTGALVLTGGYSTPGPGTFEADLNPTLILDGGNSSRMTDWPDGRTAVDALLSPVGGLLILEASVGGTPIGQSLIDARWDDTAGRYLLTDRTIHAVGGEPLGAINLAPLEGGLSRIAYLPGAMGILINEQLEPELVGYGGVDLQPTAPPVNPLEAIFFGGTLRLHADAERLELWPDADPIDIQLQLTLDDVVTPDWFVGFPEGGEPAELLILGTGDLSPPGGALRWSIEAHEAGSFTLLLQVQDGHKVPALSASLPVQVNERESIYSGFGCDSGGEGSVLLAGLMLLGLIFLLRRRGGAASLLLLAALLPAAPVLAAEKEDQRPKMAFLGVTPGAGVDELTAEAISDYIQTLAAGTKGYRLIRLTEVKQMLGFEAQRQLLGCDDEGGCMADIAGALEVDRLLRASVSRLGESMVVQLTLLDGIEATQLGASGMRLEKTQNAEAVLDVLPEILNEIFATDPRFEGKKVKHRSRNVRSYTRERRWSFGAGVDIDLNNGGDLLFGAHVGYRGRILGFGLGLLPRMGKSPIDGSPVPVGMRGELRLRLFRAGPVHPHLAAGVTYFPKDVPLPRVALHVEIDFHRYVRGFVSIAGEALVTEQPFDQAYLLLNVGASFTP